MRRESCEIGEDGGKDGSGLLYKGFIGLFV